LVDIEVDAGQEVIDAIRSKMRLRGALWYYFPEAEEWRLVLITPLVDQLGSREVYSRILKVIRQSEELQNVLWRRISARSPKDPLIRSLQSVIQNGKEINHRYVDGAYVYFFE